jgi:hypothetical protein
VAVSFFSIIGKLLGLVPAVTEAVRSIASAATPKTKSTPHPRKHNWQYGLSVPPTCAYCGTAQTQRNVLELCKEASV